MKLFIVRHGEAEVLKSTDAERALTSKGINDAKDLGRLFKACQFRCHAAIVSPYIRARMTLDNILDTSGWQPEIHIAHGITPDDPVASAYREMAHFADYESLLVVSHLPLVSRLVASLVDGVESSAHLYPMMPASVAEIDLDILAPGAGKLTRLLSPPYHAR